MSDTKTILLVEDDILLLKLLTAKLKKANFEVVEALDGTEALEKLRTLRPDLILLDLLLPRKNGFEVLQEINEDPELQKIPVVIISNLGQETHIARGKALGAREYFIKARLSIDELLEKLKEILK